MVKTTGGVGRWRLIWMFLQTFIVLHPVLAISSPGDFTSVHLAKYLNKSVSPCSDFHRHVCSIGTSREVLPIEKSKRYYEDLAGSRDAAPTKNIILNDYISAHQKEKKESCIFNAQTYKSGLGKRCGYLLECYLEELYYFFHLYKTSEGNKTDATLQKYVSNANRTGIPKIVEVTSKIIDKLVKIPVPKDLEELMILFSNLQKRLAIMSSNKENRTDVVEKFYGVEKIRKAETIIRKAIGSRLMETAWLNETNEFGLDLLSQYLTTLSDLRIVADFDKFDYNLWSNIDRLIKEKYLEYGKRSTGCALLDVVHPIATLVTGILNNKESIMTHVDYCRLLVGFAYNAFNIVDLNSIFIPAPTFYPFMWQNSSDITQLGFAASIVGHEIFHSFINITTNTNKGACNSGNQTLNEDGPDLEGLRVAYELLKHTYTEEQLQVLLSVRSNMRTWALRGSKHTSMLTLCANATETATIIWMSTRASNIRLNAAVALMPEFTEAFGCQKGDMQYSEESTSCYLFGPLAGTDRKAKIGKTGQEAAEEGAGSI